MPTHYAGQPEEVRALNTYIKLSRAADTVGARINGALQDYGLTVSQFGVMEALHHLGTLQAGVLAGKILRSGANMTTVLDNLERRGFVVRKRKAEDRRCIDVELTDAGRSLVVSILPEHVVRVHTALSMLTPDEQDQLAALCKKVGLG